MEFVSEWFWFFLFLPLAALSGWVIGVAAVNAMATTRSAACPVPISVA